MNAPPPARLLLAAAVIDPAGVTHRPGAVLVRGGQAVDWGPASDLEKEHGSNAVITRYPDRLLMPGLVNAHAHLELTHIGPQPYTGDFVSWVVMLRRHWPGDGNPMSKPPDVPWFADAAGHGAQLSLQAGVQHVGDISRCPEIIAAQREQKLQGVGYRELFGLGPPWDDEALQQIQQDQQNKLGNASNETKIKTLAEGWQPHAPYSTGPAVYAAAADSGLPVSTHLAETLDELEFLAKSTGPVRDFLQSIGKWDDAFSNNYNQGYTPVQWMRTYLRKAPWLLAHCNYVTDDDIALLAETSASVAYCPVASDYFGHPTADHPGYGPNSFGKQHRYRDMLDAGVNVCLGTDSIVCQPPDEKQPMGILPQMRFLYQRDGTPPDVLFRMATVNGRRALQQDDAVTMLTSIRLNPSAKTDPLTQALRSREPTQGLPL